MPARARSHDSVRKSYDEVAGEYAERFRDELSHKPLDRALLAALVEEVAPSGPIADLGCGPGHVTAWLADHGARGVGIDISPGMLEVARQEHPAVEFRLGDLLSLPCADGEFAGAVAFYSIIHLGPAELVPALEEIHRVLGEDGLLLVSFHVGSEVVHREEWWGHEVDVDFRFLVPSEVVDALGAAGFEVRAALERSNYPEELETRRSYVLARRRSAHGMESRPGGT